MIFFKKVKNKYNMHFFFKKRKPKLNYYYYLLKMTCQLHADCLNEIFEYLEEDKITLYSCLLVNHYWSELSVRILWRNIWNFKNSITYNYQLKILGTLIACLPNKSKELLLKNGIFISTPTSKPPFFNYPSFCKVLSIIKLNIMINYVLKNHQISSNNQKFNISLKDKNDLVAKEIINIFINQNSSLRTLIYCLDINNNYNNNINISNDLISFKSKNNCFMDLLELKCNSNHTELFHQLIQLCHNIQSLDIIFKHNISNDLKDLIFSQNYLKSLSLIQPYYKCADWIDIIPSITKHSNTITKLFIQGKNCGSISFISKFKNLKELILSFEYNDLIINDFNELQYINFTKLQILRFDYACPKVETLITFLKNNGNNLKELYIYKCNDLLNLTIAKFCPNLKSLFTLFMKNELETLKLILISCQQLESIKIWCGSNYLKENELLEFIIKYSSKNFHELRLYNYVKSDLLSKDLESFFIGWKDRIPQKSVSFIVIKGFGDSLDTNNENMKIIEKYKKLGIIKKFLVEKNK
jgi:hypothetical protein